MMELAIQSSSIFFPRRRRTPKVEASSFLPPFSISNNSTTITIKRRRITSAVTVVVRSEASPSEKEEEEGKEEKEGNKPSSISISPSPPKSSTEKSLGFGSSFSSSSSRKDKKKKKSGQRATVIRRSPIEKPSVFSSPSDSQPQQQTANENAFLLTWLGLGFLILVEGIALAASGFLPEQWDKFFVKYLYPSFTPTVFLFVGGTVAYGVLKYLQSEQRKS